MEDWDPNKEEEAPAPQWHKDVLDERELLVAEGKAKYLDWEVLKKRLGERKQKKG